jgi:hypothetical protein
MTMLRLYDPVNSALLLTLLSLLFWGALTRLAHRLGVRDSTFVTAPLSWLTAWAVLSALPAIAHYVSAWLVA